ncbi:glia maturation factor gamma isoform X1 [Denticeps clupeoides]|uniref:glia maturation factor gamma isoform X1 n=1 Tax=Denticeps clupeoides TaxID=299321 RepID=UPI0010A318E3|nr:uncharacterized protein LOC114802340 isoform X1 [Denticeps clupeoides]
MRAEEASCIRDHGEGLNPPCPTFSSPQSCSARLAKCRTLFGVGRLAGRVRGGREPERETEEIPLSERDQQCSHTDENRHAAAAGGPGAGVRRRLAGRAEKRAPGAAAQISFRLLKRSTFTFIITTLLNSQLHVHGVQLQVPAR